MGVVVEAAALGDGGDGVVRFGKQAAGVFDSDREQVLPGAGSEGFAERAFELAYGKPGLFGEVFRGDGIGVLRVEADDGGGKFMQRGRCRAKMLDAAREPCQSNNFSGGIAQGNLVGDDQVRRSFPLWSGLHAIQLWLSRAHDLAIVGQIFRCPRCGKKILVRFSECFAFGFHTTEFTA